MRLSDFIKPKSKRPLSARALTPSEGAQARESREQNAIYQEGKLVARVRDSQVDMEAKQIRFSEIYHSDELLLPDECEFQQYRIIIQKVGFVTRALPGATEPGRVLKDCEADILGFQP
jgi:hypothetical protein